MLVPKSSRSDGEGVCLSDIDGHVEDLVLPQHRDLHLHGILGGSQTQDVNVVLEVVMELQKAE